MESVSIDKGSADWLLELKHWMGRPIDGSRAVGIWFSVDPWENIQRGEKATLVQTTISEQWTVQRTTALDSLSLSLSLPKSIFLTFSL